MTWFVIGLVLAVVSGVALVPYLLLLKPWRVKRLAYFLMARWPWYERWVRLLMLRVMARSARKLGESLATLVPAAKRAAAAFEKFGEAVRKAGLVDA